MHQFETPPRKQDEILRESWSHKMSWITNHHVISQKMTATKAVKLTGEIREFFLYLQIKAGSITLYTNVITAWDTKEWEKSWISMWWFKKHIFSAHDSLVPYVEGGCRKAININLVSLKFSELVSLLLNSLCWLLLPAFLEHGGRSGASVQRHPSWMPNHFHPSPWGCTPAGLSSICF